MQSIGIDFGSTYTIVSEYKNGVPVYVESGLNSSNYPSVVSYNIKEQEYDYGRIASGKIGNNGYKIFRGFKMLLSAHPDNKNLEDRGYDGISPEYISKFFLKSVIENSLERLAQSRIDLLVIGAPLCWFESMETIDARAALRKICYEINDECGVNIIGKVKIVSEPTSAAAYCVWKYNKENNGQNLDGSILVIDYGGGTLDTAIVSVKHNLMGLEIKTERKDGAGENRDKKIGDAGIAFQEAVIKQAISEQCGIEKDKIPFDQNFNESLKNFEQQLLFESNKIRKRFKANEFDMEALRNKEFCSLHYGRTEELTVTYYMLFECYNEVIAPVLKRVLDNTVNEINDIPYIALIGGFCNFYLVEKQIFDYFKINEDSEKRKLILNDAGDRENAIAYGASLIGAGVIKECHVAEFSIGTYAFYPDGTLFEQFAIKCGEEYTPGKIYTARDENNVEYSVVAPTFDRFLINLSRGSEKSLVLKPRPHFLEQLKKVKYGIEVVVGFSIDIDERIVLHIFNCDPKTQKREQFPVSSIQLSTFNDTFESTVNPNRCSIGG